MLCVINDTEYISNQGIKNCGLKRDMDFHWDYNMKSIVPSPQDCWMMPFTMRGHPTTHSLHNK